MSDALVGKTIDRRYEVVRLLGEGAMGAVYEVRHTRLGKRFAMKIIRPEIAKIPEIAARFEREASSTSRLKHRHCIEVIDFGGAEHAELYLVMEFLEGMPMSKLPTPSDQALVLTRQVLLGLSHAHSAGIVHRDIKPDNIMLVRGPEGGWNAKILDFGIAKIQEGAPEKLTATGIVMGTAEFMAPEQAAGEAVDERADIYAVGVMLWNMLTGRPLFFVEKHIDFLLTKISKPPPQLSEVVPAKFPAELDEVVRRSLARDVELRFRTADAFIEAIDALPPTTLADPGGGARRSAAPTTSSASGPPRPDVGMAATMAASAATGPAPLGGVPAGPTGPAHPPTGGSVATSATHVAVPSKSSIRSIDAASPARASTGGHRGAMTLGVGRGARLGAFAGELVARARQLLSTPRRKIAALAGGVVALLLVVVVVASGGDDHSGGGGKSSGAQTTAGAKALALAQAATGQVAQALAKAEKNLKPRAVKLDPAQQKLLDRGKRLLAARRCRKALEPLNRLRDQRPKLAVGYYYLGSALICRHRYEQGLTAYRKALELDPGYRNDGRVLSDMKRLLHKRRERQAAVRFLAKEIGRPALPLLEKLTRHRKMAVRKPAVEAVGKLGGKIDWAATLALDLDQTRSCEKRAEIVGQLRDLGSSDALSVLRRARRKRHRALGIFAYGHKHACILDEIDEAISSLERQR